MEEDDGAGRGRTTISVVGHGESDHQPRRHQHRHHQRSGGDLLGRHRLAAAISRLDKEIESLQEELEELETMEPSSAPCKQVISSTERLPDALLPVTGGPENPAWERWFQRIGSSHGHKWYSFKRTI